MKNLNNREQSAYDMRNQGYSFRQIGKALNNVGPNRARQIYRMAVYKLNKEPSVLDCLSARSANCLRKAGIRDKESAIRAVKTGFLHPDNRKLMNYGWVSHKEVCRWLNLPEPRKKTKKVCPHCGGDL